MFAVAPDETVAIFGSFESDGCSVVVDKVEIEVLGTVVQVNAEDVVIDNGDCSIVLDEFVNAFVLRNVKGEGIPELKLVIDVFKGSVAALFKVVLEECKGLGLFVGTAVL